jgi:hypothetical protein
MPGPSSIVQVPTTGVPFTQFVSSDTVPYCFRTLDPIEILCGVKTVFVEFTMISQPLNPSIAATFTVNVTREFGAANV